MVENIIHIEALDCLPFANQDIEGDVWQEFISSQANNVFYFSSDYKPDTDSYLAEYNFQRKQWIAGRFIGEAFFNYNDKKYKISIKPRFGDNSLFRMLEEIFNIRFTKSFSEHEKQDWQHFIKRIIAYIWVQKLANANLHGLPRVQVAKINKGFTVKGRIDIRKSVKPFFENKEIVSISREREFDSTISNIIYTAYSILKKDFIIGKISIPDAAQEAINQLSSIQLSNGHIEEYDYKNIRYKDIYLRWKPLVDFSWDIIKRKRISLKQKENDSKGFGFFVDMAEIWECYVRSLLKKGLISLGWHLRKDKIQTYKGLFFSRELIPDIVFQKGKEISVWDAKYKRMQGYYKDVDRADFFQIHTYIQYFLKQNNVKSGGLIYPLLNGFDFEKSFSSYLMNEDGIRMDFCIDGVEMQEKEKEDSSVNEMQIEKEKIFVNRIIKTLS